VNEADDLVGLVTLYDVLAATDSILREDAGRLQAGEIKVEDVMIRDLATVDEHASLRQAALFIENHGIGCLPVVTDGNLRGIVTDTDFVGVAINLLEQIEESEPMDEV
jgi:CBS domain-containing protein